MTYYTKPVTKTRAEIIRTAQENRKTKLNREKTDNRRRRELIEEDIKLRKEGEL